MKKRIVNNKKIMQNTSLIQTILRHFFLLAITFTFFLQQIQAVTNNNVCCKKISTQSTNSIQASGTFFPLLSLYEPVQTTSEMEAAEDDEKQNNVQSLLGQVGQQNSVKELGYECILRSRYLQLTFSAQQHPAVPFFILHHSWKNYIA